ncbi:MAG: glycine cleavage system protein GcvH [Anaerolineae bacterium]|nr:glycine cleavage system protein GcvH [Anaerolineae bacterium]MCB9131944.1 glycine cleavage system protein GcvH [Anaerolineales bacterium]MCB9142018.1 glycine cleavage system protein GcvH [Anaerolineales bacterium]
MAYKFDATVRYAQSHDWARLEGDLVVCGISDYAQHALSDVVFIELPSVGDTVAQGDIYSTVESVKAAEQVYAPVSGEIVAVNDDLEANPELINEDPYGAAWIIKVKPSDAGELDALMDAAAYESLLAEHE